MASPAAEPAWLEERRRKGASLASELELPTQKQKGWEFTDLSGFDPDAFAAAEPAVSGLAQASNGSGAVVLPLGAAVAEQSDLLERNLGSLVSAEDPFVARNEADWRAGVLVWVPAGAKLSEPLQLRIAGAEARASGWRALVILEEGAEAEVWEHYGSDGDGESLFNSVVELRVGEGARLRYVCEQDLAESSWVFANQRAEVGRDASLEWVALGFGSARGKVRMETKLAGKGASAKVTGAYAGSGSQHLDYDTRQEHAAEHTTSDLSFRGVLADRSTAVWRGMIRVDRGAQQTDAFQESRNLLLSPDAHADAIPGLEIEADDVRCTHAAAVAQVNPEQLHYLRARGLQEPDAKRLIIDGFLAELVDRTNQGSLKAAMSGALERRLVEILGE